MLETLRDGWRARQRWLEVVSLRERLLRGALAARLPDDASDEDVEAMGRFGDVLLTPFGSAYAAVVGIGYGAPFALVFGLSEMWTARGALLVGLGLSLLHGVMQFRRIRERGRVMHATAATILARRRTRDRRNTTDPSGPEDPVH